MPLLSYNPLLKELADKGDIKAQELIKLYNSLNGNYLDSANIAFKSIGQSQLKNNSVTYPKIDINIGARAYLGSAQDNIKDDAFTKVLLDTETFDSGGNFASNKYTVGVGQAGYYLLGGGILYTSASVVDNRAYSAQIYVNGASVAFSRIFTSTPTTNRGLAPYVSDIRYLTDGNYVELYAGVNDIGGDTVDIQTGENYTWLYVWFLSK
jgi:hypothetical protein